MGIIITKKYPDTCLPRCYNNSRKIDRCVVGDSEEINDGRTGNATYNQQAEYKTHESNKKSNTTVLKIDG
jgi:hypothetical protein